jgi:hypothetical protein
MLPKIFEGEVAADAEADQSDVSVLTSGMLDDALEVFPSAAVIGAKKVV